MDSKIPGYSIVILAGGASRRMGTDKWMMTLDGTTLLERMVRTFHAVCEEIWIIAAGPSELKDANKYPDWTDKYSHVHYTCDDLHAAGPLGGIMAGIQRADSPFLLAAASDMPFPSLPLGNALVLKCAEHQADVALPLWQGRMHPLFAVYRRDCLSSMIAYVNAGGRKVLDWVGQQKYAVMSEEETALYNTEGTALFNMNDLQDYEWAQKIYRQKPGQ